MVTAGFAALVAGLWLVPVGLFWVATGWGLPTSCPRLLPIDGRGPTGTWPIPVGVAALQKRLALEEQGSRWWRERNRLVS